jgi:hypothetical protein
MIQKGWLVEPMRIPLRKEYDVERLVGEADVNTTSEGNGSAIDFIFDRT